MKQPENFMDDESYAFVLLAEEILSRLGVDPKPDYVKRLVCQMQQIEKDAASTALRDSYKRSFSQRARVAV
ncbi:MAG: hypothetical protein K0U12_04830 [Gammaproteobacteria bacterium]|nr:hypothetical protein [Gammaproteobacteria bacterium]